MAFGWRVWGMCIGLSVTGCGSENIDAAGSDASADVGFDVSADAGGDAAPSVCEQALPIGSRVFLCFVRDGSNVAGDFELELTGPVLASGASGEFSKCANTPYDPPGFWIEMADAGGEIWTLGMSFQASGQPPAVGETLSVKAVRQVVAGTPTASLTIRSENGELKGYAEIARDVDELTPPDGIELERGKLVCTGVCEVSAYDLDVNAGGAQASVAYGDLVTLGGHRVAHGGYDQRVIHPDSGACTGTPDGIAVGIVRAQ